MKDKKTGGRFERLTVKQLLLINATALAVLLVVVVLSLWATGLLGSVIKFIF